MGKASKEHKKKIESRNQKIKERKAQQDRMKREFIMDLIKKEKDNGSFENSLSIDGPIIDGPIIDGPIIDGPIIDGPII